MKKSGTPSPIEPGKDFYAESFGRNIGLVTEEEQAILRGSRVAVAGLGGVGGIHALTLARLGIGRFNLADMDVFGPSNINRQMGATVATMGRPKVEVMAEMLKQINPDADVRVFPRGVQPDNVDEFLRDVDVVIDSVDYFSIDARTLICRRAREKGQTVLMSAPLGFSGTLHVFSPTGMSFERYYDLREGMPRYEKLVAFAVGLAPGGTHWSYMDLNRVDLSKRSGPSLACACTFSAGLVATEAMAILLRRRPSAVVPRFTQFDPYRGRFVRGRLWFGNRGPLQRVKRWLLARRFRNQAWALE